MRVYCGLASAGDQLTAAVVDDCGQVAALQQIHDDAAGYAQLVALLGQRVEPAGVARVPVAMDAAGHTVGRLLVAAGREACFVGESTLSELAAAEPADAAEDARRAVAMARGLYAGCLAATMQPVPPQLAELRPVLHAHLGLTLSRAAALAALREVLRQMYPAALHAFPDPGTATCLAVLEALPDPALLAGGRDESVVARLVTAGFADADEVVTALHTATRHREHPPLPSVGAVVRQSVAAVQACDTGAEVLLRDIGECLGESADAEPAPADSAAERPTSLRSVTIDEPTSWLTTQPPADEPTPTRSDEPPVPRFGEHAAEPDAPTPGGAHRVAGRDGEPGAAPPRPTGGFVEPAALHESPPAAGETTEERPTLPGEPEAPRLEFPTDFQPTLISGRGQAGTEADGYPDTTGADDEPATGPGHAAEDTADRADTGERPGVRDLGPVPRPPVLRPVGHGRDDDSGTRATLPDVGPRTRRGELSPRARRRVRAAGHDLPPRTRSAGPPTPPETLPIDGPAVDDADSELLIFAEARSAWFAGDHDETDWDTAADEGWRAAQAASSPSVGNSTQSGLPRRVPQANLVPGSPEPTAERPSINRDASRLAAQTSGYFKGWQRGRHSTGHEPAATSTISEAFTPAGRR